jgi:hypothetical protein
VKVQVLWVVIIRCVKYEITNHFTVELLACRDDAVLLAGEYDFR